ncbi:hypothetical protein [Pedomonas sp. V897]|uniref:hypothetical protein n=1 Tax=Pedomonas sp. V897 TaxID=3446482 RepID=UPI003EE1B052
MSPNILNAPMLGETENGMSENGMSSGSCPDETARETALTSPETSVPETAAEDDLEDRAHNPWRNREDDASKWLGLLLAAIGAGAIGYLITGA